MREEDYDGRDYPASGRRKGTLVPHSLVVLDASAALALLLAESEGAEVEEIIRNTISINGQIFVPGLFWYELGNGLLMAERKKRIAPQVNAAAISSFAQLPFVTDQERGFPVGNRIMNLAKLFPWIPRELSDVLMHFSYGTDVFYESVQALLDDLYPVVESLAGRAERAETRTEP